MKKRISLSLRQLLFTAFLFLLFSGLTLAVFSFGQNEKRFTNITSRLFREEMQANTLNMHYTIANPASFGIYSYTPTLPAYQDSSTEQNHAALDHTLSALNGIHIEKLSQEDAFLCTLLTRYLETSRTLSGFSYYGEPLSPSSGMQSLLVSTPDQKKIDFFVPSNITSHYTCYCSILKAIFILAEERSATFSRHSKLHKHPSYLKNGSSVFHTISILSSPLIITFLITFWIFSLSKDSILMIFSNCVSNLPAELSSVGSSDLSCSIF